MGNDGGSIPKRSEVVKTKKRDEKASVHLVAKAKSGLCSLTKDPLRRPVGVCKLGFLYNREEVIKKLLEKTMPTAFRHIRKLKDVKEVKANCTINKESDSNHSQQYVQIVCPLTQIDFTGFNGFYAVWDCGCILSEDAIKQLKMTDKCLSCGFELPESKDSPKKLELISLNQTADQQERFLDEIDK